MLSFYLLDQTQVGKHDKIGMNVIQLKDLTPEEPKLMTLELLKSMEPNEPVSEKSHGQLVVEVEYKSFKEVKGVLVPFTFTEKIGMPQRNFFFEYKVKEAKLNDPVDDDVFIIPDSKKAQ